MEAHARVGVCPVAEAAPQRGGEAGGVGVGALEREEQRRPGGGAPIGGSSGGRSQDEEDGDGEGLERAGPGPAATRHGAASSRGEWAGGRWRKGGGGRRAEGSRPGPGDDLLEEAERGRRGSSVNARRHRGPAPSGTSDIFCLPLQTAA